MSQKQKDIEEKFFSVITSLLGREPSKEEMQKILEPIYELGDNA